MRSQILLPVIRVAALSLALLLLGQLVPLTADLPDYGQSSGPKLANNPALVLSRLGLYPGLALAQGGVITKTGETTEYPGGTITYDIIVYKSPAEGDWLTNTVAITDVCPANTCSGGDPSGTTWSGWIFSNPAGKLGQFKNDSLITATGLITVGTINLPVDAPLTNGTLITNTAHFSKSTTQEASNLFTTTILASSFSLNKTASSAPVCAGGLLTYTVAVSNIGTSEPIIVYTLTDRWPDGVGFVSASDSYTYIAATRTLTWSMSNNSTDALWLSPSPNTVYRTMVVSVPLSSANGLTLTNYVTASKGIEIIPAWFGRTITVTKITPDFTSNAPVPFTQPVSFGNTTSGDASFLWSFGDGATSTEATPLHYYTGGGIFNVVLTATSAHGCGWLTATHPVTVTWPVTLTWSGKATDTVGQADGSAGLLSDGQNDGAFLLELNLGGNSRAVDSVVLTSTQPPGSVQWDTVVNPSWVLGVYSGTTMLNNPTDGTFTRTLSGAPALVLYGSDYAPMQLFTPGLYTYCVTVSFSDGSAGRACTTIPPSFYLQKSDAPDPVQAGATLVYTLTYSHTGGIAVGNAWLTDTLPLSTALVASTPPTTTQNGSLVSWNLGSIPASSGGQVVMTVTVGSPIISGTVLTNPALVVGSGALSATAQATTTVQSSHALTLTKSATPDPVLTGAALTYTIAYSVTGSEPAAGAVVTDALPENTSFRSATGGVSPVGGVLTWTLGTLNPPTGGVVTFTVQVTGGTLLTNTAHLYDGNGGGPLSATATTTVQSAPATLTATLSWNGKTTDTVRLADGAAGLVADGLTDGGFILALNLGGGLRTVSSVVLTSTQYGVQWDTISPNFASVLGVYSGTLRLNNPTDGTFTPTLTGANSFILHGSDTNPAALFTPGLYTYCATVSFTDSSQARACTTISTSSPAVPIYLPIIIKEYPPEPPPEPTPTSTPTTSPCYPQLVTSVSVGVGPHGVAVDSANNRVYVANYTSGSVSVIDGASSSVAGTITGVPGANGIAYDGTNRRLYVTNRDNGTMTIIETVGHTLLGTTAVGWLPNGVAYNPVTNKIYVANYGSGTVTVFNAASPATPLATVGGLSEPSHVAVDTSSGKVYVTNHGSASVTVINGVTNSVAATISLWDSYGPYGIAIDTSHHYAYVVTIDTNRIVTINTSTDAVLNPWTEIKRLDATPVPLRVVAVDGALGSSGHLYITTASDDGGFDKLLVIPKGFDEGFNRPFAIDTGANPLGGVAVNQATHRVYVTARDANRTTVVQDGLPPCLWNFAEGYVLVQGRFPE